jgi:pimeloyl-ACP methyl ester carboxylesterase
VLFAAAAVAATAATLAAPAPRLTGPHPCPGHAGFTCSTLTVPLDRDGRRPGTLRLAVAAADNVHAPRGVLLLISGGPGQPAVPLLDRVDRIAGRERSAYRIVVYDQRGTGAGALECPALQAAMGSSDLAPPPAAAVRACAGTLGPRRAFYGTDDVVADMDALRAALGAARWTLDGVSYGTFVAERYALTYPSRVARLVLDSVVPDAGSTSLVPDELHAVGRVLRDVCGSNACGNDLAAIVRSRHDGPALLDALTLDSIVDPTYTTAFDVPDVLAAARRGDGAALDGFLSTTRGWEASTPAAALSQGLHASALCADWRFPWGSSAAPLAGRDARLARAVAGVPAARIWPFDRATLSGNGLVRQCLPWTPTPPTPAPGGTIRVPTLLLAGSHDLSTPLEWARLEAGRIPGSRLVVVPGAGHSVQSRAVSDAGRAAVARFLLG